MMQIFSLNNCLLPGLQCLGFLYLDLLLLVTVACPVSDHITTSCVATRHRKCYTPPIDYRNNCASQQIKHRATDINPASIQQKYFLI